MNITERNAVVHTINGNVIIQLNSGGFPYPILIRLTWQAVKKGLLNCHEFFKPRTFPFFELIRIELVQIFPA